MNNGAKPQLTGGTHWLEFLPGYVYCFLPSLDPDKGEVHVFGYPPSVLDDFLYSEKIKVVIYVIYAVCF
jgi:hypothetical protein